jgi:hypothetical protein
VERISRENGENKIMAEMMDFDADEWERIAARKEFEREQEKKEIEELERLNNLPFYLRIQDETQKEYLREFEARQKQVFMEHSVKKWKIKKEEATELFQEFFTEFLNGKTKSIREFLISRGYNDNRNTIQDPNN